MIGILIFIFIFWNINCRVALVKDPEHARALLIMGQTLLHTEQYAEAAECLEKTISKVRFNFTFLLHNFPRFRYLSEDAIMHRAHLILNEANAPSILES